MKYGRLSFSDLAFDVDFLRSQLRRAFKTSGSGRLSCQEVNVVAACLEKLLNLLRPDMFNDKLGCLSVTLEAKLLGDETKFHVLLITKILLAGALG